jgi:predicted DNA repair protein MutK
MAGVGLLALLDDIATLLDDVAVYSKVAAKNTAGVLGDDLALNAQQVSGVRASRELPVVWAVAKGSLLNKLILVPAALLISAFLPWLVSPLLMLGGLYLCFEGVEKLLHAWRHRNAEDKSHREDVLRAAADSGPRLAALERQQIKGAIRTDFILSAEIIVIALGASQGATIMTQVLVVSLVALLATAGVYGLVSAIVKFDDAGLALIDGAEDDAWGRTRRSLGHAILFAAPRLMKLISVVGMAAMFLVGGGILVHGLPFLHHLQEALTQGLGTLAATLATALFSAGSGVLAGLVVVGAFALGRRVFAPGPR